MLTQKQEDFCLNIISGMTATNAALTAGYANSSPTNTTALLKTTKVARRLTELRRPREKSTIATVEERQERLTTFIREDLAGKYGIARHSNIQATAELNKMTGDYAPIKTDHTFNGEGLSDLLLKLRGYKQLPEGTE